MEPIITTHPLSEKEKRLFGIFISHSSKDEELINELQTEMRNNSLDNDLIAEDFIIGGDNFHDKIKECIHCHAGVVVLTKNALESNWVGYECGYFDGLGMPVIIWDKDGIMSFDNINNDFLNVHLLQYMPSVKTAKEVIEWLNTISVYSNMFKNEIGDLDKEAFNKILSEKVETVMVQIESSDLNHKRDLFERCTLSTLVVNFGMFYDKQCQKSSCACVPSEKLCDGKCIYGQKEQCAMISSKELQEEKQPDCVILNHVLTNGKYFNLGDKYHDGEVIEHGTLSFYVPVHRHYGTEFKFIIDAPNFETHKEIFNLLSKAQLNPTISNSLASLRIYLSLPSNPSNGIFRLNDGLYYNNFLCPHSTMLNRK